MTMTLMLSLVLAACGDETNDTDTDTGTSSATGASTSGVTDTTVDPTAADTTAADTTAADTTAAEATTDPTAAEATTDPTTGAAGLSFAADVWEPILVTQCGCHQVGASGGLLMGMDAASAYASMVNVPSSNGMPHVTPGDSDNSYLFHKSNGSQADVGGGGSTMPLGAPKLGQADIDTITAWITDGAAP